MYAHFFFFNDTATTEIYTLSLHDALPICITCATGLEGEFRCVLGIPPVASGKCPKRENRKTMASCGLAWKHLQRSEEHTSELQSRQYLVCRLLLEKKKKLILLDTFVVLDI